MRDTAFTLREQWLQELESGDWKKGHTFLHSGGRYCCLGVFRAMLEGAPSIVSMDKGLSQDEVLALGLLNAFGTFTDEQYHRIGICNAASLAEANDKGATFKQIAAFCRKHPELVFVT